MHELPLDGIAVPAFLRIDADGKPSLHGSRCLPCGAIHPGKRAVCPACGARGAMAPVRFAEHGTLRNYTIVHRSFPGVETPFVAAVVDVEGGGCLRGILRDVAPSPEALRFDMPLDIVFRRSSQTAPTGQPFVTYCFVPSEAAAS